jgi:hypothetical protein
MSQETLKKLRLLVPGALLFIFLPPLFQDSLPLNSFFGDLLSVDFLRDSIIVIALGALYVAFDLRRFAWQGPLDRVNNNIKTRLLQECDPDPSIAAAEERLRQSRALMNVFYHIVDDDHSLTAKQRRVYFNGLLWTSVADLETISAVAALAYLVRSLTNLDSLTFERTSEIHHLGIAVALVMVALVARFVLMPILTDKHIELSNDQLEFMHQHYRQQLCSEVRAAAIDA